MSGGPTTGGAASPTAAAVPASRPRLVDLLFRWRETSILLVAIVLAGYFQLQNADFLGSSASLENLSQFVAPWTIIACGEIMLMIGGEIDLSAGMTFAFAPFVMFYAAQAGVPVFIALLLAVAASALVGLVNGLVTVVLGIPSFVTTLGTLFLLNGITLTISSGQPVSPPGGPVFQAIFGNWGYSEIIWAVAIVLIMNVVLRNTRWGLHTDAAGANKLGASETGINVRRLQIGNFVICGMLAGFTGLLEGFRITSSDPLAGGTQVMFYAVAAGVIGGTPLAGGSGTIIGGLIGAAVLGVLQDGLTLIGTNAFVFPTILGAAILAAMVFNLNMTKLRRTGGAH
jgi:simple sugar transport system permease protein